MAITPEKKKTLPIVIIVLVVLVLGGFGYYIYTALTKDDVNTTVEGKSLDTSVLDSDTLQIIQYESAQEPTVEASQLGRENPFAPY